VVDSSGGKVKKEDRFAGETFASLGVALQALIGTMIIVGAAAVVLRIATGKW
jgi:hypothetical protein